MGAVGTEGYIISIYSPPPASRSIRPFPPSVVLPDAAVSSVPVVTLFHSLSPSDLHLKGVDGKFAVDGSNASDAMN